MTPDNQERKLEMSSGLMKNVYNVGDLLRPAIDSFKKKGDEMTAFANDLREKVAAIPPETCIDHPEVELELDWDRTFSKSWLDRTVAIFRHPCKLCVAERVGGLVNERWRSMGVPDRLIGATLDSYVTEVGDDPKAIDGRKKAIAKARRQLQNKTGFIIFRGAYGTGKSHIAVGMLKEIGGGIFITEADLIAELRQTYVDNSGQQSMVDKYRTTPFLILDELTLEVKGVDIPALLYRILGYRHDKGLLTAITSNETLKTILDILGGKLTDRIKQDYQVVTCEWQSFRSPANESPR